MEKYKIYVCYYYNMKFIATTIISIIKRFVKDDKKILGRWNIEICDKKTNRKIDLSNEDHCGPCGQYIFPSKQYNLNKSQKSIIVYKEHHPPLTNH